MGGMTSP